MYSFIFQCLLSYFPLFVYSKHEDQIIIPGGEFYFGNPDPANVELPQTLITVEDFYIDPTPVTNGQFAEFIADTGYVTEAENFKWSFVFQSTYPGDVDDEFPRIQDTPWWLAVEEASWKKPEGLDTTWKGREDYPAIQISFKDARKYCNWAGKQMLTEKQWEYAARGGVGSNFWWGDEIVPDDQYLLNFWQGEFPNANTKADGHLGPNPVKAYSPNPYGVFDMLGNTWEWTRTNFKYPPGQSGEDRKVIRGGSFIDSADGSFNDLIRVTTRMGNTPDSGANNMGFRCGGTKVKKKKRKNKKKKKEEKQEL